MKRIFIFSFLLILNFNLFAQFSGIWEGKDRIVFFEQNQNDENKYNLSIILKEYYGWYYDRTAEPENYAEKEKRIRNTGTTKNPVTINLEILPADTNDTFTLELDYSKSEKNFVPVFIHNDKIYLDFYTKVEPLENSDVNDENPLSADYTFWKGNAVSKGILVSSQSIPENIAGFIIQNDKIYNIRYWKSKMDYSSDYVNVTYEDNVYFVPKHLISGENLYSCVSGRSKNVRNVQKPETFSEDNYLFNDAKTVFTTEKTPYLTKITDKQTFEDLMQIIREANSRRKPDPAPLFPVKLPKFPE